MVRGMTYLDYEGYARIEQEEMIAVGMEAVYEAVRKIDISKVKDEDAWVSLVVRRKQQNFFNLAQNRACWHLEAQDKDGLTLAEKIDQGVFMPEIEEIPLDRLSKKEWLILKLRYWKGWTLPEIGEALKCSKVNVYYHEQRALKKISKDLLETVR
jgi:RNA polymerase sigma factor (sigma-70 family)